MNKRTTGTPSTATSEMTDSSAPDTNTALTVPDVTGMTLAEAARSYAEAGWFVLPVSPDTKNPGSVVGNGWQEKSSRNAGQIREWWEQNADYGIALHAGRSGAVVFDLDNAALDELPAELRDGLAHGVCQLSRKDNPDRGHYLFLNDEGYGNGAGAFAPFGDVRGKNGVIIAAPTPHVQEDGEYRWARTGRVPPLPDDLRACLRAAPEHEVPPMDETELGEFFAEHINNDRPGALRGVLTVFGKNVGGGMSRHEALVNALPMAYREAVAGCYPAEAATAALQEAFLESFLGSDSGVGRNRPAPDEFARTARWAAAQALLADPNETLARLNRDELALEERVEAFWTANKALENLRQFAHSRGCSPWGVFGSVLPRAVATIPPYVALPALVGTPAGLNLFVALVAGSGGGKGNSEGVAREYFPTENALVGEDLCESEVGSGNGILKLFARSGKGAGDQINVRDRAMLVVDEVDSFIAEVTRPSSNTSAMLRSAWSGKLLGGDRYVDESKNVTLQPFRYRLTMTIGVQPEQAEPLFEEAGGGTPQRFLWLPTQDAKIPHPDDQPLEPESLILEPWPGARAWTVEPDDDGHLPVGDSRLFLEKSRPRRELVVLSVPESIAREVKLAAWEKNIGVREDDPLDGHAVLTRLKVAVGLMRMDGRTAGITEDDWDLADVVMEVSKRTRSMVTAKAVEKRERLNLQRGTAKGHQELAMKAVLKEADNKEEDEQVKKYAAKILRKLGVQDDQLYNALKKSSAKSDRQRELFDVAAEGLVVTGQVETYQKGKGTRIRLAGEEI